MNKILFFLSAAPHPIDDGIKKINDNLIKAFLQENFQVTIIIPKNSKPQPYKNAKFLFYEKKRNFKSILKALLSLKPLYFPLYFDENFKVDYREFKLIFYDFYPMTQYFQGSKKELFMMPDSMKHLALSYVKNEKNILKKIYHLLNYFLCKSYNQKIKNLKKLYVSNEDIQIDNLPNSFFFKIPADIQDFSKYHAIRPNKNEIAFRGVMSFEPNITAVKGFYKDIFLDLIKHFPQTSFKVIGKDPSNELKSKLSQNTSFSGFVDDIFLEMSKSAIHVVPMISGSGVKTKMLDSIALKRLVFATPKALNGIFQNIDEAKENGIIVYQNKEEFIYNYKLFMNDKINYHQKTQKAYDFLMQNSYQKKVYELLEMVK